MNKIEIDKDDSTLSVYDWCYYDVPLSELKKWVDAQIEKGMNAITVEISWGYYNDIDAIDIIAKK